MKQFFLIVLLSTALACNSQTKNSIATVTKSSNSNTSGVTDTTNPNNNDTIAVITDSALSGSWQLQLKKDEQLPVEAPTITINMADKSFYGNTGCNNMSGTFTLDKDNHIIFGPDIIMTKKACPGYNEKAFITNFTQTNQYRISNGILQLMNNNDVLTTWVKRVNIKDSSNKI